MSVITLEDLSPGETADMFWDMFQFQKQHPDHFPSIELPASERLVQNPDSLNAIQEGYIVTGQVYYLPIVELEEVEGVPGHLGHRFMGGDEGRQNAERYIANSHAIDYAILVHYPNGNWGTFFLDEGEFIEDWLEFEA